MHMHTLIHSDIERKLARTSILSMSSYGNKPRKDTFRHKQKNTKTRYTWFAQIFGLRPPIMLLCIIIYCKGLQYATFMSPYFLFVLFLNSLAESTSKLYIYIPKLGITSVILPSGYPKPKIYNLDAYRLFLLRSLRFYVFIYS